METQERSVSSYTTKDGINPFRIWRASIGDKRTRLEIDARILRLAAGKFGKGDGVGGGVRESKIEDGPGYRIYYGTDGDELIILLLGGDKSSQKPDIELAKEYWRDYKKRKMEAAASGKTKEKPKGKPGRRL